MTLVEVSNDAAKLCRAFFEANDWVALLLKNSGVGWSVQRTGSLAWASGNRVQSWLRARNDAGCDVYVSINALAAGARSRTRRDVVAIRHLFLDIDQDVQGVLQQVECRLDLPPPNYLVRTSPSRAHVLWRVDGFSANAAERLQKQLAAQLGGDLAATTVTQLTRLPGFVNHKYREPHAVWVDYRDVEHVYTPRDFPAPDHAEPIRPRPTVVGGAKLGCRSRVSRARAYLSRVPPAVAGNHGDLHTYQTCCRVVRGFALDDDQALAVLAEWNARCLPPWTERGLLEKIRSAHRNGREPNGGLL